LRGGEKITYERFRRGINNLIATNNFDTFRYKLEPSDTEGDYHLRGQIRESRTSTFLKLGLHYDDLYKSAVLANITKKRLLTNNDIASLDLILGDNSRYNFDYFIDKGFYLSLGINSRYNQFSKNINPDLILEDASPLLANLNKVEVQLQDFTNQIYIKPYLEKTLP
jgi:NTE family protein